MAGLSRETKFSLVFPRTGSRYKCYGHLESKTIRSDRFVAECELKKGQQGILFECDADAKDKQDDFKFELEGNKCALIKFAASKKVSPGDRGILSEDEIPEDAEAKTYFDQLNIGKIEEDLKDAIIDISYLFIDQERDPAIRIVEKEDIKVKS